MASRNHWFDHGADPVEAGTDREALDTAVVDALEDRGQLVVGEAEVPGEVAEGNGYVYPPTVLSGTYSRDARRPRLMPVVRERRD